MWRSLLAATAVVMLAVLGPEAANRVQTAAADLPEPGAGSGDLSRLDRATAVAGLAVLVERQQKWLIVRRDTTYTIAVGNRGPQPRQVVVRAAVPPWLRVAPPAGAHAGEGFVDWRVTLPPGEATTLRLTGAYGRTGQQLPPRVSFTACALDAQDRRPITCATDVAEPRAIWWHAGWWALAGLAVAAIAGLLTGLRGPRRRRWLRRADSPRPRWRSAASGR